MLQSAMRLRKKRTKIVLRQGPTIGLLSRSGSAPDWPRCRQLSVVDPMVDIFDCGGCQPRCHHQQQSQSHRHMNKREHIQIQPAFTAPWFPCHFTCAAFHLDVGAKRALNFSKVPACSRFLRSSSICAVVAWSWPLCLSIFSTENVVSTVPSLVE